jgi:hypothetical protein
VCMLAAVVGRLSAMLSCAVAGIALSLLSWLTASVIRQDVSQSSLIVGPTIG